MTTNPEYASLSLQQLVLHVFRHRSGLIPPLYYSELAERIGRIKPDETGVGTGMGTILGILGHMLEDIEDRWGEPIPHIQSLVVSKNGASRGVPDNGIVEFWPDYPSLSFVEKQNKAQLEYQKIIEFGSRWSEVLNALKIPLPEIESDSPPRGYGGESEQHRLLKEYIRKHPEVVGANPDALAISEYALPTLDAIDVYFKMAGKCLAVEVKSSVSDKYPKDYERGIFQIIKYRSVLSAMSQISDYDTPIEIDAVLVLESRLPVIYQQFAERLNVRVIENVRIEHQ